MSKPEQLYKMGKDVDCCVTGGLQDKWTLFSWDSLYKQLRDHTAHTAGMAALDSASSSMGVRRENENGVQLLDVRFAEGNYFQFLGVAPFAGRMFTADDDRPGAAPVAVISHTIWATKFNSDPRLVGSTLLLTGHPVTVVGIAREGFLGERNTGDPAGVWVPLSQEPVMQPERNLLNFPAANWLDVLVRIPNAADVPVMEQSLKAQLVQYIRANESPGDTSSDADVAKQSD